ncbi:glycoside hydrolase family 3 N-terminal domain-containing protein [Microbacterium sp. ARD31]|uniref:glycoside hydrolase family 3 protein n=1 Tax=Microbacterium sp. ARD31 TaxID=2962576 RepID=UPI002881206D|nr:glycoside hydrolase family 3 N-terminal domain-containing protein [Microbacterium sp. ARD31]MDT0184018.1 glycoside hydrolase family 3 N-terminal domain-containing protein [Microbacterium sp. ARD31]
MTTQDTTTATSAFPYQDVQVPVERRVEDLLSRMTLEDKAGVLFHTMVSAGDLEGTNPYVPLPAPRVLITERRMNHFAAFGATDPRAFAEWSNILQRMAAESPLGIPVTLSTDPRNHFTDNPLAVLFLGAFSVWPEPTGLAAIGSEELVEKFGDIARQEYTAVGLRSALHPQIDLSTEPRWGRISSTFGEDADLTSRLVAAYIRGFQGESLGSTSVATMPKHFPGGGPQKDGIDAHFPFGREQVYPGDNFDYHLEPFRAAIAAGAPQIMPYYGMPVGTEHEEVGFNFNKSVITGILRNQLGYDGLVCTDFTLLTDTPGMGEIGKAKGWGVEHLSREERIVKLFDAGVDQLGGEDCTDLLVGLVRQGRITEDRIDQSVRRVLRVKFSLGLFENPFVDEDAAASIVGRADFVEAGRQAQQRALTLLTNEPTVDGSPTLPLRRDVRVYVEGLGADALEGYGAVVGTPAEADVAILRLKTPWTPTGDDLQDAFHQGTLEFTEDEQDRIAVICQAVPTVIDIHLERPAVLGRLATEANAVIANYGIGDRALVEVLFGDGAPEGNLPFDLPSSMDAVLASRTDVPFDTADPTFRFGHGLRY